MDTGKQQIPHYISALVAELEHWIRAATAPGVSDADSENYSLLEDGINVQLQALGWSAVLADTGHWIPILAGYTIVNNPPDPHFYPERCYQVPEGPAQWRTIWQEDQEVRFKRWEEAYAFVFAYLAEEQAKLPLKRFSVRPPNTGGGNIYVAGSAEQALLLHRNYWLSLGWVTPQQAVELDLVVFEHCGDLTFYCGACQHAPCKYTPEEKWPMPARLGWIGSSL